MITMLFHVDILQVTQRYNQINFPIYENKAPQGDKTEAVSLPDGDGYWTKSLKMLLVRLLVLYENSARVWLDC